MKRIRVAVNSGTELSADEIKHKKPNEWPDDEVEYFEQKLKEANEGLSSSQFLIGRCYKLGFGTIRSSKMAIEWYQKAADQSHLESCLELGLTLWINEKRDVVQKEPNIVPEWKNKAVSMLPLSLDEASNYVLYVVGMLYLNGFAGYEKSTEKAMEYFTKSANKLDGSVHNRVECYGSIRSMNAMGRILMDEKQYSQSIEWYLKSAELGDRVAMSSLGYIYRSPDFETDYQKAMEWYLKSAALGCTGAMHNIGMMYQFGECGGKDFNKAMDWFLKSAELGYVHSMNHIAKAFRIVEKDYKKAMKWYLKLAELGKSDAMFEIGKMYLNGRGIERDYNKAMEWFLKSAELYNNGAMFEIGNMYLNGRGVEKDYNKAMGWFLKSAELGHTVAMYQICTMYMNGEGIEQDYKKAMEWYLKLAELGKSDAMFEIGKMYLNGRGIEIDYKKAMEWYLKSAELGHNDAMFYIGTMYANGEGIEQDYKNAMEWYLKSAELGHRRAMFVIGNLYSYNDSFEKDYKKAMEWYLKSAELGNKEAMYEIGKSYRKGFGVEKDLSKAIEWYLKSAKLKHQYSMKDLSLVYKEQKNYLESSFWLDRRDNYQVKKYTTMKDPVENFGRNIIQVDYDMVQVGNGDEESSENMYDACKTFIVRLIEGDMKVNGQVLKKIPFFQTMVNENWMKIHEEEDGETVLDFTSIDDETLLALNILNIYFIVKQDESTISQLDSDSPTCIQLFNLAKYFTDTHFMKNIIEKVGIIERWYLLNDMNQFTPTDYMVLELYLLENIQIIHNLSLEIIQSLFHDDRIHCDTKMKIIMERQIQQPLEVDLEDIRVLLTQPKASIYIIPKLKMENSICTQALNCTLNVKIGFSTVSITITNTAESTNPIQVYLQTHFKCLSNNTILKSQGHLLEVGNKPIVLRLHSPFEKNEKFEFEFSGLIAK